MNFVFIITDTQCKWMVGAYGQPSVDTPHLDRLAAEGIRFNRAYTTCPLCTPARSAIFSGQQPQINGAWCNNVTPHADVPLMGTIFRNFGYRTGYTGKWHLDGAGYFGDAKPGGGFEADWWYDGARYIDDIPSEMFARYRTCHTPDDLRQAGYTLDNIWGHRVADRAVDFLEHVDDEPFVLAVSFDEPHEPYVAPPEYWERFSADDVPRRPNYQASLEGKPRLQQIHAEQNGERDWQAFAAEKTPYLGCNAYIDREIGRVIDAVDRFHGDDTVIIYTSDHGDQMRSHGLLSKGPMMYEESCNIPLIVRLPDGPRGVASDALVSQIDLMPTMLALAGLETPESLHGTSLLPLLHDPDASAREMAMISFGRFAINHDQFGGFYPIRCATDGRYKLAINLLDTDELYDLQEDPYEMTNRVDDPACHAARNRLHDWLLTEMDRIRDPFRCAAWAQRPWRQVPERALSYWGGPSRPKPTGFSFESKNDAAATTLGNSCTATISNGRS